MARYLIILITGALLLLVACSTEFQGYSSLVNQGILPLSTTNAHVGANLFIAQEAQRSSKLKSFLEARGGPTAIEILDQGPRAKLLMFYPKDQEVFAAELEEFEDATKTFFHEWIIRGPYQIERLDYRELAKLDASFAGEPVFLIKGQVKKFKFEEEKVRTVYVPVLPTPAPTPTPGPKRKVIKDHGDEEQKKKEAGVDELKPLNTDQLAILMSKGYAERAENGDLIHSIRSATETLVGIAKWYTGNEKNVIIIAATNEIQLDAALAPNMRIRVPAKLLITAKVMPEGYK